MDMKLSEAIMLGMLEINPSNTCWYIREDDKCSGCLVGAALYAVGSVVDNDDAICDLMNRWQWVTQLTDADVAPYAVEYWEESFSERSSYRSTGLLLSSLMSDYKHRRRSIEQVCDIIRNFEAKYDAEPASGELVAEQIEVHA